ncbi:MAG: serine hydrolase [Treponema sp.]|nr:serine hydrolase [Treponema sp.]
MKSIADLIRLVMITIICAGFFSCASVKSIPDSPRFAVPVEEEKVETESEEEPEKTLPNQLESPWQLDVTFPYWADARILSVDTVTSFQMYHGQGVVYLTPTVDCKGIKLYVNGKKISMPKMKGNQIYEVNISSYTRDGTNSLQLSGIKSTDKKTKIRLCVPFPTVLKGSVSDSGIPRKAFRLIDKIISADVANGFSSAQLAVIKDGRLVYDKSWGNVQTYDGEGKTVKAKSVTSDTMYDIASVTKMFSVAYAMQYLVAQGKVSLETKITDILGEEFVNDTIEIDFKNHDEEPLETIKAWKASLTVRDVLSHRAGEHPGPLYFNDNYDVGTGKADAENVLYAGWDGSEETRQNTLRQLCKTPLTYEPRTDLIYSDVDYMLMCFVIEKITGKRLDEFLQETFWEPLGLRHITYNPLEHGFSKDDCTATEVTGNKGYDFTGRRDYVIQGEVHDSNAYYCMGGVSGHSGIFSSAKDLAVLASVMLTGGYGEQHFFSRSVIDAFTGAQTNLNADYGIGWWRQSEFGTVKHFGSICPSSAYGHQGFTGTLAFIDPEKNLVIVFLTNKRHVPYVSQGKMRGSYAGNYYVCGSVSFVPQIIELGLTIDPSRRAWKAFAADMVEDMRRNIPEGKKLSPDDPRVRGFTAMKQAKRKF